MISRAAVVHEARRLIDTPYMHQARKRGVGADCIGLVGMVGLALGLPSAQAWANDPTLRNYGRDPDPNVLMHAVHKYLNPVDVARPGDIYVMRWRREPSHFAIVSQHGPTRIVHAYAIAGRVCENNVADRLSQRKRWQDMILSAWSYKEVAD